VAIGEQRIQRSVVHDLHDVSAGLCKPRHPTPEMSRHCSIQ
jgi:hypothetical protein